MMNGLFVVAVLALLTLAAGPVRAASDVRVTERGSAWNAAEKTGGCTLLSSEAAHGNGIVLQVDDGGPKFIVRNEAWSLPDNAKGTIHVMVDHFRRDFPVDLNGPTLAISRLEAADWRALLDATGTAAKIVVAVGNAPAFTTLLTDDAKTWRTFRRCAGALRHGVADASPLGTAQQQTDFGIVKGSLWDVVNKNGSCTLLSSTGVVLISNKKTAAIGVNKTGLQTSIDTGAIRIVAGTFRREFDDVEASGADLVVAFINRSELRALVDALETAETIKVAVGETPAFTTALTGDPAKRFRKCVGLSRNTIARDPFR